MIIVYYKHFQNCSCFITTNIYCFCSLVHRPTGWCPQIVSCIQGCVFVLEPRMKQQWPLSTPFSPQWTKAKKCRQISMNSCHVDPQSGTGTVTSTHTYRSMPGLVSKSVVWDVHPPGMGTLQCPVSKTLEDTPGTRRSEELGNTTAVFSSRCSTPNISSQPKDCKIHNVAEFKFQSPQNLTAFSFLDFCFL